MRVYRFAPVQASKLVTKNHVMARYGSTLMSPKRFRFNTYCTSVVFDLFHFIFIHMILMTMIDNVSILKMLSTGYCGFLNGYVAMNKLRCVILLYIQIVTPPYFSKKHKSSQKKHVFFAHLHKITCGSLTFSKKSPPHLTQEVCSLWAFLIGSTGAVGESLGRMFFIPKKLASQ